MAKGEVLGHVARFALFLERLESAPAAANEREALDLVAETLNDVEDDHSGVPYEPSNYLNDGRMYPPQKDNRRQMSGRSDMVRYRTKGHNVFIGMNGSVRIEEVSKDRRCCLSKAGADGRPVIP